MVDLISSDAVQVETGDPALLTNWGGPATLTGEVKRIDPLAITGVSDPLATNAVAAVVVGLRPGPLVINRRLMLGVRDPQVIGFGMMNQAGTFSASLWVPTDVTSSLNVYVQGVMLYLGPNPTTNDDATLLTTAVRTVLVTPSRQ